MISFRTDKAALEYAEDNLGKYEYEIVKVDDKLTYLCATTLPIEEALRDPIEDAIREFLEKLPISDNGYKDDVIAFMGAELCGKTIDMLNEESINILCAHQSY